MKRLYQILVFTLLTVATCLNSTKLVADNHSLPDSLLTDDCVYDYTFSNFDKAEKIMQELRKQKKLPPYRLDVVEGDLYFNTGHYYRALKFYKLALESDSIKQDDHRLMEQIHRLISCYDCLHNETRKAQYVDMLLKSAKQCGDKAMQSVALFNMGKMLYYQGNKERGYEYMQRAVGLMEKANYKYKYDNLRYNYNTLLTFQELDRRSEEALRTLEALQKIVIEQTGNETPMEGLGKKEKKAMYAHYAVVLSRLGRLKEAEAYYTKFQSVAKEYDRDDYLIMPYLFDRKRYDAIIRMNSAREKELSRQGDTVTYHMTTIKKSLGRAYEEKGDYRTSSRYFRELALLRDSIKNREQKSSALELATIYETHEKDMLIQQQTADARIRNAWLWLAGSIAFLMGIILWRTLRHAHIIKKKNEAMAGTITELLKYKEELYRHNHKEEAPAYQEENSDDVLPNGRELFYWAEHEIISRQLFLQPESSREELIKKAHIPKNKFALLFKRYAGMSFPRYMNKLRLEYAAQLLQDYPGYSVDAIAQSCGISSTTTFYRLFSEAYGMTPMDFRHSIERTENEKDTD